MRPLNDDFNPQTEEEQRRHEENEEFNRRVRREVLRIQSGEADEDIERDKAEAEEREAEAEEQRRREQSRRSRLSWQIFSGSILTSRGVAENYRYFALIAVMCFISIVVMFAVLYADLRYSQVESDVQLLRERSIRLQEELYGKTTHKAIREELDKRGIDLREPHKTKAVVEE